MPPSPIRLCPVMLCLALFVAGPFSGCSPPGNGEENGNTEPPTDDPCLVEIDPQQQDGYATALADARAAAEQSCITSTTGTCTGGDGLGTLMFIFTAGFGSDTRYYDPASGAFVGFETASDAIVPGDSCMGVTYGPLKIECTDQQVTEDLCEQDSTGVSGTGTLSFVNIEGGCFKIDADDGSTYEAANLSAELQTAAQAGDVEVSFVGALVDAVSACQIGTLIQLESIETTTSTSTCDPSENLAESVESGINIDNQADCETAGGVWQFWGESISETCNIRAADAGKNCCDAAQCEGACIDCADADCSVGTCSEFRRFVGCARFWRDGQIDDVTICD